MSGAPTAEAISDYERFDFAGLWEGREKVTEVERAVLLRSLHGVDSRRLLEIGTGFGRLLDCLTSVGQEVVALDFDTSALARIPPSRNGRGPLYRVGGNVYHLPFVDGAFTGATMIRVLHHLADPVAALTEVGRVLRDGARLVVSYSPKPSVGTIVNDVQRALKAPTESPFRSATFSSASALELPGPPFPVIVGSRSSFESWARAAGFEVEMERGAGLEEYRFLRSLPSEHFVRWAEVFGRAPGFPMRFAQLRLHSSADPPMVSADRIFACPRCRAPLALGGDNEPPRCEACSYLGRFTGGVTDLRYVPDRVLRYVPDLPADTAPR
jgi:ubiquinone/menaquinone biosynthesis C-methylase UbiE